MHGKDTLRQRGSITIYLSLIFTVVTALLCTVIEAARVNVINAKVNGATYIAAQSVLGEYVREIFDEYGLMMYRNSNSLDDNLKQYINSNLETDSLLAYGNTDLFGVHLDTLETSGIAGPTDNGCSMVMQQISEYMKYRAVEDGVDFLLEQFGIYKEEQADEVYSGQETEMEEESQDTEGSGGEDYSELFNIAEELSDTLGELEDIVDKGREQVEKASGEEIGSDSFVKKFKKVLNNVEKLDGQCIEILNICTDYEAEKNRLCSEDKEIAEALSGSDSVKEVSEKVSDISRLINELSESEGSYEEKLELAENIYTKAENVCDCFVSHETGINATNPNDMLKSVKELVNNGILGVVVTDVNEISDSALSTGSLPSEEQNSTGSLAGDALTEKALFAYYLSLHFGNYTDDSSDTALSYELEYILSGKESDRENLVAAVEKLFAVREVFNVAYLYADSEKRNAAYDMALAFTSMIGLPELALVAQAVIMLAWGMAESVSDVRTLLAGGKVPIIKTKDTWKTSISGITSVGESSTDTDDDGGAGITYENYIQILLLLQNDATSMYRMLDLIQANMQKKYDSSFIMSDCIMTFGVTAEYRADSRFLSIPLVRNIFNLSTAGYSLTDTAEVAY